MGHTALLPVPSGTAHHDLTIEMVRALAFKALFPGCSYRLAAKIAGVSEALVRQKWMSKPAFARFWTDREAAYQAICRQFATEVELRSLLTLHEVMLRPYAEVPVQVQVTAAAHGLRHAERVKRQRVAPSPSWPALSNRMASESAAMLDGAYPTAVDSVAVPVQLPQPGSQTTT